MSDLIKKILIYLCILIAVFLIYYILKFIYRILTNYDPMVQKTISNERNLENFYDNIGKITLDSINRKNLYFKNYEVIKQFKNYKNFNLYNNKFDTRLFVYDDNGNLYKNLNKILIK